MEKPRQIALRVLQRHAEGEAFLEEVLSNELQRSTLGAADRGLVHELVCGVVRFRRTLDWLVDQRTDGRSQPPLVMQVLRLGLYQLLWLDRIPPHAAVHETVELAKAMKLGPAAGFVNALLRGVLRELEPIRTRLEVIEQTDPDIRHSHPRWLFRRWETRWGRDASLALMRWNNQPPRLFVRVNTLRTSAETLESQWQAEGVRFARCDYPWAADVGIYELQEHAPIPQLKTFLDGGFYIQDPSTLLAVTTLDPQPGDGVLDLCAAPGGKTTLIAQRMQNQGRIIAQDTHRARLQRVRQNCDRLGVTCVELSTSTGVTHPELSLTFDRILVDAPCSNTGVMRRRVDLRWRVTAEEIQRLRTVQIDLLHDASLQLKPGGSLVYSTCSLEPEENEAVVREFLAKHPEFRCLKEQQLTPFEHHVDGAFVALLRRRPTSSPGGTA